MATFWFIIVILGWAVASMIASQFIIALPMVAILGDKINLPVWVCIYDALVYLLALALVLFVPRAIYRIYQKSHPKRPELTIFSTNAKELGVQHLPTFVDLGLAPIGYVVYMIIATGLTSIMSLFSWFDANQAQDVGFNHYIVGIDRIVAMLALIIIAPIAEEVIMRGWLYGKLRSKLKVVPAVLLVSIAFGLLHGQWNVAVSTFALSIVLCSLREITGTIWAGILLHILSNGIAFYLLYIAGF